MMMQIGMDEHFRARVSDRPAKLILDHWTVGAGAYSDERRREPLTCPDRMASHRTGGT